MEQQLQSGRTPDSMDPSTSFNQIPAAIATEPEGHRSVWPSRISTGLLVMVLMLLPWTTLWSTNSLLDGHMLLRRWLMNYFVRGVISGIGLMDLFVGISEAVHYRDPK